MLSLPWSRAATSISTGILLLLAFAEIYLNRIKLKRDISFYCLIGIVFLCLLDGFRSESLSVWLSFVTIKLPLMLLSFVVIVFNKKISSAFQKEVSIYFCIAITLTTLASSINYGLHYHQLNALVLQSKPIPISGNIHHITFSVFCALAVFVSAYYALAKGPKWLWAFAIINFIGLHILSARTGLVGFYFATFVLGSVYVLNHRVKKQWIVLSTIALALFPLIAFFSIHSFQNRVLNSWEDIKVIFHQHDANYQSMGMRIEASLTALDIAKKHPLIGVGCANLSQAMAIQYEENHTNLFIENRILPHNQFVIETAIHGIIGLILFLIFFSLPFFKGFKSLPPLFIAFWALILFASMFECLFDRQHGILLISIFWFLYSEKRSVALD